MKKFITKISILCFSFLLVSVLAYSQTDNKPKSEKVSTGVNKYGHNCVDMGLPSGTLWATCNLGASSPTGYGDYVTLPIDMSAKGWDNNWNVPTIQQYVELLDSRYTSVEWTTYGLFDDPGYLVVSKINGNSIFFQSIRKASGPIDPLHVDLLGPGYYWTSTRISGHQDVNFGIQFGTQTAGFSPLQIGNQMKCWIRPVLNVK